nr:methyltransferase domain-containing protein [Glaciimonas immobilis]
MTPDVVARPSISPDLPVSSWIRRFAKAIPAGPVLDLACGEGRHSFYLAAMGKTILAVDRNADMLARIAAKEIATRQIDLEAGDTARLAELLKPLSFAGIVVTNYLHRPLVPLMLNSIADQGVLLYETFAEGNQQFGRPSNPDFLLNSGELLQWLIADAGQTWQVLAYEEGYVETPKPAMIQRIFAKKGTGTAFAGLQLE